MEGKKKERWLELCAQAAVEQNARKLAAPVAEISRLLREKEDRLGNAEPLESSGSGLL